MAADAESFDYIVTGAGSAGCAVAARLSESGRYRVLLLEAGGKDRNPWIHIPMGFSRVYANPRVNWMYESEPEAQLGGRTTVSAARQGPRRHQFDQRHGVYAGQCRRLRRMAPARLHRLGLGQRAAVLQEGRTPGARRQRVPRRRRPAACLRSAAPLRTRGSAGGGGNPGRPAGDRGLQ